MVQGRLHQAASTYQQALNLAARRPGELDTGLAHLGIGGILREWNKLEDATGHILEGIAQSQKSGNVGTLLFGYVELAQVKHAQGNEDASLECIEQVEQIVKSHAFPQFLLASIVEAVTRIYIARGDIASAMRWAEASVIETQNEPENWHIQHMFEYLTSARIGLVRGAFDEALALLDRLRQFAEAEAYSSVLISMLVLQALALEARGRTTQAMTALAQALTLAEPNGYVRIFVDEGPPMADLLMKILKVQQKKRLEAYNFSTDYAGSLLAAYRSDAAEDSPDNSRRPAQPLLNPLSERELEVLRLIANGLSNQEIVQKLIVEKNTLKTHIRHLYRKLNTRSRTQAIIRARALNLL
jgi:LuxR family maltose regulon positive regulatory protein